MVMTMKDTGLVAGVPLADTPQHSYKVVKGFYDEQHVERKAGETVQLSERFASTLMAQGRIVEIKADAKKPEPAKAPERQAPPPAPEPHHEEEPEEEAEDRPTEESEEEEHEEEPKRKGHARKKGGRHR